MLQLLDQRSPAERDWRDPDNVMFTPRDEFKTLADCGFNVSEAARRLGMHRRTLARKLGKRHL